MHGSTRALVCGVAVVCWMMVGCSAPSRGPAVPRELWDRACVLDNPAVRSWYSPLRKEFLDELVRASRLELDQRKAAGESGPLPPANYLAISGGGANGAFGAGLLCGWTAKGDRPKFKLVTGISTGALTAPFAFLGPKYDDKLRTVYTSVTTKQIAEKRGLLAALYNDALMDTKPLRSLLNSLVDENMMHEIAAEYAKGRLLLVLTTDLDANRAMIWNIGAIAASGHKDALKLIQSALLASASIPAAFPPVMIDVEVDGKKYQEMHVDGGAKGQLFLYPPSLELKKTAEAQGIVRDRVAYLIRNSRLDPEWANIERRTLTIAGRAISSLIQTQGIGDLYRMYLTTQRDKVDYNLAYIPSTFNEVPKEEFDPVYMKALFQVGYDAAVKGYPWQKTPPGYLSGDPELPPGMAPGATPAGR